jgi:sec-independent protein translocase protein TatB
VLHPLRYDWSMNFSETIFLFLVALLIFGPKKLPEIARQVGKALNEFKRASNEFKAQIEAEVNQLEIQEREKKREQEQKILPPAEPPAGTVQSSSSSLSSSPEQASLVAPEPESRPISEPESLVSAEPIAPPDTATHTNEMNPSTPHTTNV